MSLSHDQTIALQSALTRWRGTPYIAGNQMPGQHGGVDCLRYVDAVLHEVFRPGDRLDPLPRHAQDAALHNTQIVYEVIRIMLKRFDMKCMPDVITPDPGDVLAVRLKTKPAESLIHRPSEGRSRHLLVVTNHTAICSHAIPGHGVVLAGRGGIESTFEITGVYRSKRAGT